MLFIDWITGSGNFSASPHKKIIDIAQKYFVLAPF
jgi:hypothetical protein